uniref:Uncharacterized protein n=1 Tax=Anopheles culicifacies TaxID=139723 RepID=A0A182MW17_9DIPT
MPEALNELSESSSEEIDTTSDQPLDCMGPDGCESNASSKSGKQQHVPENAVTLEVGRDLAHAVLMQTERVPDHAVAGHRLDPDHARLQEIEALAVPDDVKMIVERSLFDSSSVCCTAARCDTSLKRFFNCCSSPRHWFWSISLNEFHNRSACSWMPLYSNFDRSFNRCKLLLKRMNLIHDVVPIEIGTIACNLMALVRGSYQQTFTFFDVLQNFTVAQQSVIYRWAKVVYGVEIVVDFGNQFYDIVDGTDKLFLQEQHCLQSAQLLLDSHNHFLQLGRVLAQLRRRFQNVSFDLALPLGVEVINIHLITLYLIQQFLVLCNLFQRLFSIILVVCHLIVQLRLELTDLIRTFFTQLRATGLQTSYTFHLGGTLVHVEKICRFLLQILKLVDPTDNVLFIAVEIGRLLYSLAGGFHPVVQLTQRLLEPFVIIDLIFQSLNLQYNLCYDRIIIGQNLVKLFHIHVGVIGHFGLNFVYHLIVIASLPVNGSILLQKHTFIGQFILHRFTGVQFTLDLLDPFGQHSRQFANVFELSEMIVVVELFLQNSYLLLDSFHLFSVHITAGNFRLFEGLFQFLLTNRYIVVQYLQLGHLRHERFLIATRIGTFVQTLLGVTNPGSEFIARIDKCLMQLDSFLLLFKQFLRLLAERFILHILGQIYLHLIAASSGAMALSIVSLSLSDCCFTQGSFSLARLIQLNKSS